MSETKWIVQVSVNGEHTLTIEDDGCLCGIDPLSDEQENAIRAAGESLLGFIGKPRTTQAAVIEQPPAKPLCERCSINPSVTMTRWGKVQAICRACADMESAEFVEATTPRPTGVRCPDCGEQYVSQSARADWCSKCSYEQGY